MALPTFVREQMLGLDDAARLREALRTGDWWQATKSSAAIAVELGGTASLVGFPIAAGVGALNRRLARPALPALTTVASPSSAGPAGTRLPNAPTPTPFGPPLPPSPVPLGPPLPPSPVPFGPPRPTSLPLNTPLRRPGMAPGSGLGALTQQSAPMPQTLLQPTAPVPPRPFAQQAFPGLSDNPAAAVTRTPQSPFELEFPMTTRPPLAEVVRRPPGINPQARGVQAPTSIGPGRVAPPGVRPGLFSMPGVAGGADDIIPPRIPLRRNVRGAPTGRPAPMRPEEQEALNLAGRVQRGEAAEMIASARRNAPVPARADLPEVEVPEFTVINLDKAIEDRLVSARLLRESGIRTQQLDQFGNKIDAPMSVDEYFSLPVADREAIGITLDAKRRGPKWIEYRRGRKRGVTEPSRPQGMVAQEKYFDIDPATGKPKTSRMPGTYHGPPGDLERELDQAIARMEPFQYSTGAAGSGERTGRMVWEAAGGDTKMLRNARLQALDVPPWKYVVDDAGNTVYRDGFPLVEDSYWKSIPGIEKALRSATPEQAQWIKTFGARRWHQINSEPNVQVLSMLKHRTVGGFNGRGYDRGSGIIAVPRTTKAGVGNFDRLRINPEQIGTGQASTRAGMANYDLLDFSDANMLDEGLINEEFADLFMKTFNERFRNIEGLVIPRWGIDETGAQVRVGWRRPTPEERMNLRIARGPKPKKIEGQGARVGTTLEEMGLLD